MKDLTGAYLTNKYQQTSVKDVYMQLVIVQQTFSSILNQNTLDYSISNAVRSAYIASKCIMETFHPFSSHLTNGFSIYDYKFLFYWNEF